MWHYLLFKNMCRQVTVSKESSNDGPNEESSNDGLTVAI